jgi:hypothetical protein
MSKAGNLVQAESERRAQTIHAEGEFQASQKFADAGEIIAREID